jgi:hypothetical protein
MAMTVFDALDRYGLTGELIYENALRKLLAGQASIEEALDYIMEFARGNWSLVIDENLESLADALAGLNYAVKSVPKGMPDDEIRKKYGSLGVFITSNDRDFSLDEAPAPFEDGLILVPNGVDAQRLARAIERVLMTWRKQYKAAPVRCQINRGDL